MPDLMIPYIRDVEFREHYRALIADSVRRSPERSGTDLARPAIRVFWVAAVVLLLVDLAVFGVDSWTTSAADIAVMVLTISWFWVSAEDLLPE